MIHTVRFTFDDRPLDVPLARVVALGYTGRDRAVVQEHVDELAELGVAPPPRIPMAYPVMPTLVTPSPDVAVLGYDATPEIEVALLRHDGTTFLTVASDHTDRVIERTSVARSKNACPKIVGPQLWRVDDLRDGWDDVELTSRCNGVVLQRGTLAGLLPLDALLEAAASFAPFEDGTLTFSGTVPTSATPPRKDGVTIELTLHDPASDRTMRHGYTVHVLEEFGVS